MPPDVGHWRMALWGLWQCGRQRRRHCGARLHSWMSRDRAGCAWLVGAARGRAEGAIVLSARDGFGGWTVSSEAARRLGNTQDHFSHTGGTLRIAQGGWVLASFLGISFGVGKRCRWNDGTPDCERQSDPSRPASSSRAYPVSSPTRRTSRSD